MNRLDFFKKLGIGTLAVVVAPKVLAEVKKEPAHNDLDAINGGKSKGWYRRYFHQLSYHAEQLPQPSILKGHNFWHVPTKDDQIMLHDYLSDHIEYYESKDGITWDVVRKDLYIY